MEEQEWKRRYKKALQECSRFDCEGECLEEDAEEDWIKYGSKGDDTPEECGRARYWNSWRID